MMNAFSNKGNKTG